VLATFRRSLNVEGMYYDFVVTIYWYDIVFCRILADFT